MEQRSTAQPSQPAHFPIRFVAERIMNVSKTG
jgi:hypothetical protein